ncbi:MAG TPA: sialate O-acetylesterase [Verrucomicrobiae bacterium]
MLKRNWVRLGLVAAAIAAASITRAEVKLPALFSDNMVLQRDKPIAIWGWAEDGEKIAVKIGKDEASTEAKGGKWLVYLPKQKAGGPLNLTVRGKNELTRTNVLVGEVWICSGQSNMEWPMRQTHEPAENIQNSKNNKIRLFTVPKLKANEPTEDIKTSWRFCEPSAVSNFSAVAYYFGRDLQKELGVPVGLIHTSWGGSPAEVWMREEVLAENALYKAEILDPFADQLKWFNAEVEKWEKEKAELEKDGKKITRGRPWGTWKPAELYNGMIAPLIPYAIRGAIWYQGESNAGKAHQYRSLFADMISNWRADFGQGDFPFLLVQLAPWDKNKKRELSEITKEPVESDWAELREAQLLATKVLPNVGMAVITDVGDKDDIHPVKKEPVGARLARAARGIAYGEKLTYSGPVYRSMTVEGNKAIISFDHVGRGLVAKDGDLKGFAIAGKDRKFVWAKAVIDGDRVVVSSSDVQNPVAVRFGWADFPVVNLFNKEGLPASPFRTDSFPMVTGPRLVTKK